MNRTLPAGWREVALKRCLSSIKDGTHGTFERVLAGIPLLSAKNVGGRGLLKITDSESLISERDFLEINRSGYLRPGDLLLTIVGTIGRAAIFHEEQRVAFQRSVAVLRPSSTSDVRFLFYVTQGKRFQSIMRASTKQSAQGGVYLGDLAAMPVRIPLTLVEQRAIADFLDRETAKVDELLQKKSRVLDKLEEQRTAQVFGAVLKGIDAAPLQESGVPWLGKVPAHWQIKPLKRSVTFLNNRRIPLSSEERSHLAKVYPYYGASGIIDHVDRYIFDEPTILIAEDGANLYSRSTPLAFIATGKYWVNNHAHILRPYGSIVFWRETLNNIAYDPFITGSAQPKLTIEALANILFAVPSESEQFQIANYIEDIDRRTAPLLEKIRTAINTLTEYRSALISAAVTGQIDVRTYRPQEAAALCQ